MNTLLCAYFWTEIFPTIWWGLVVAVVTIWALYIIAPVAEAFLNKKDSLDKQYEHEKQMKDEAFYREVFWANRALTKEMVEKLKLSPDEWLKNQMDKLKEDLGKITEELEDEKEKEKKVIESLELRKNAYNEMLEHIGTMVSLESKQPQDNNQVTENNKNKE